MPPRIPSPARLKHIVERIPHCTALVFGDAMLDEYQWGAVERLSPEAPVPVVDITAMSTRPGGAANVALNAAKLGATARLVALSGADPEGERLRSLVQDAGIDAEGLFTSRSRPTTVKTRIFARHQQVVRVDRELREPAGSEELGLLGNHLRSRVGEVDVVIVADYAKGVVVPGLLKTVVKLSRESNIPVVIDPGAGDFGPCAGAAAVTPSLRQVQAAMGVSPGPVDGSELERLGWAAVDMFGLRCLLVTLGEGGLALFQSDKRRYDRLAATSREVCDITGAGDTVDAVFGVSVACGATPLEAAYLANVAVGLTAAELGTAAVGPKELLRACAARAHKT